MSPITPQIRRAYHESGLTYEQIAEHAGLSVPTVARILTGKLDSNTGSVLAVCRALSVSHLSIEPVQTSDIATRK